MRLGVVKVAASVAVASILLTGCAAEPAPEPETLTISDAATRYLRAVCPVNSAWDAVDLEVDRVRLGNERGESADLTLLHAALETMAKRSTRAEQALADELVLWPVSAAEAIEGVRESLRDDARQVDDVMKLSADEIANYSWVGGDDMANTAAAARKALELPNDPEAACELRDRAG